MKNLPRVLIFFSLATGILLRLASVCDDTTKDSSIRTPDEPMYTAYASVAAHEGPAGTKISVAQYNRDPKLWVYPPPTRIGYLYLLAGVMKFMGRENLDLDAGIYLSCAVSLLSLFLLAAGALRYFDSWTAFFACLFMSVSPAELALARKVWQDGLMTLLGGAMLFLSFEISRSPRRKSLFFLFFLLSAFCLLVKESGVIVAVLCTVWLCIFFLRNKIFKEVSWLVAAALAAVLLDLWILGSVSGGWPKILEIYRHLAQAIPSNDYAVQFQDGNWTSFVRAFLWLSPFVTAACVIGIATVFFRKEKERRRLLAGAAFIFLAFFALACVPRYFKNLRYLSPVFFPYYLLSGAGVWTIALWIRSRFKKMPALYATALFVLAAGVIAWGDAANFNQIFMQNHAKDLVNVLLGRYSIYRFF